MAIFVFIPFKQKLFKQSIENNMKTYQIEILEPKAKKLLEELVKLKLIRFQETPTPKQAFAQLLVEIREKDTTPISLEEITKEVESVRKKRQKKSNEN